MGITLYGTKNGERLPFEMDMSYGTFHRLQFTIAKNFNAPFYEHYSTLLNYRSPEEWKIYDETTEYIVKKQRLKEKKWSSLLLDFFFLPDTNGEISYGTCKRIYDLIQNEPDDDQYGYTQTGNNTMGNFKKLLATVYNNKGKLKWR